MTFQSTGECTGRVYRCNPDNRQVIALRNVHAARTANSGICRYWGWRDINSRRVRIEVIHVLRWRFRRCFGRFWRLFRREILSVQRFVTSDADKVEIVARPFFGNCRFAVLDQQVHHKKQAQRYKAA